MQLDLLSGKLESFQNGDVLDPQVKIPDPDLALENIRICTYPDSTIEILCILLDTYIIVKKCWYLIIDVLKHIFLLSFLCSYLIKKEWILVT